MASGTSSRGGTLPGGGNGTRVLPGGGGAPERAAFVKMLQDRAAARGITLPEQVPAEPKDLGQVITDLHRKPGQLREMLGGDTVQLQQGSGTNPIIAILSSPMAKALLAGIAATVVKRAMGR